MADEPKDEPDCSVMQVGVNQELEKRVKEQTEKLYANVKRTLVESWGLGKDLCAAKKQVKHGYWIPWVEQKIRLDRRLAQRLMSLYKKDPQKRRLSFFDNPTEMLGVLPSPGKPRSDGKRTRDKGKSSVAVELRAVVAKFESILTKSLESGVRHPQADLDALVKMVFLGLTAVDQDLNLQESDDENTITLSDETVARLKASLATIIARQRKT